MGGVATTARTGLAEGIAALATKPVLHGDNGSTLKATTVLAMLNWLGVEPSYSRLRVSDVDPYAEALFRTAKYRPEFPPKGFSAGRERVKGTPDSASPPFRQNGSVGVSGKRILAEVALVFLSFG